MPQLLLKAGAISRAQFEAWASKGRAKDEAKRLATERSEYERLKRKFDGAPQTPAGEHPQ